MWNLGKLNNASLILILVPVKHFFKESICKVILLFSVTLLISCSNDKTINEQKKAPLIDASEKIISETNPAASYTKIIAQTKIKVLTAEKIIDTSSPHYKESYDDLNNWKLNKKQIISILYQSKEIDWHEWHYLYQNSPVKYKGKISIDNKEAYFKIEAGAVSWIEFADTSIFLG